MNGRPLIFQGTIFLFKKIFYIFRPNGHLTSMQVHEELVRRRVVKTSANVKKRSYSCNHCFSQIVICGECGEMFRRLHWNNRGVKSIVWRCISRLESTGLECHARTINELVLKDAVVKAIN